MHTALKSGSRSAPARSPAKARTRQSVTTRYAEFETAHAIFYKLNQMVNSEAPGHFDTAWHEKFQGKITKCHKAATRVIKTPAASIAEILLKLRCVAWGHIDAEYETLDELDHMMPSIEESEASFVLAGIQADLLRLSAAAH
jgi:hypothetical protein